MTLIAEDLLLLLTDDVTGKQTNATFATVGLGGAVLAELALAGLIDVRHDGFWRGGDKAVAIHALAEQPLDPVLAEALAVIEEKPRSTQSLVNRLGRGLREVLLQRLVDQGVLTETKGKVLGVFPSRRYPTLNPAPENRLRTALGAALVQGQEPDDRTRALIALLSAMQIVHRVVSEPGLPTKTIKKRAKEFTEGDWSAAGVKAAIEATQTAVIAAGAAAAAAAS